MSGLFPLQTGAQHCLPMPDTLIRHPVSLTGSAEPAGDLPPESAALQDRDLTQVPLAVFLTALALSVVE